jgi:hypothetical protein
VAAAPLVVKLVAGYISTRLLPNSVN